MNKKLLILSMATMLGAAALTGCDPSSGGKKEKAHFAFSVGFEGGLKTLEVGKTETLKIYDNFVDNRGKEYEFGFAPDEGTTADAVTIVNNEDGTADVTVNKKGSGMFYAYEVSDEDAVANTGASINLVDLSGLNTATGGFNYSGLAKTDTPYQEKVTALGQLEKFAMESHLTGITLFDNGGEVKYNERVHLKSTSYITGFGFGLLQDGWIDTTKNFDSSEKYKPYYHAAFSQNPQTMNAWNDTGSQVSDLSSYITSAYWSTRRSRKAGEADTKYEWYPVLATDKIKMPIREGQNHDGNLTTSLDSNLVDNLRPIPAEPLNDKNVYKKWRVYVKAADIASGASLAERKALEDAKAPLRYRSLSEKNADFDGVAVTIDDYVFSYKLMLTGRNALKRGIEMANDESHGIKGAQRYYNATKGELTNDAIDDKWDEYVNGGKLGINTGKDENGHYLEIELINAIDEFTAMYTLSSNLVSPLPKEFFKGDKAIGSDYKVATGNYGNDAGSGESARTIFDNVLCLAPYTLEKFSDSAILFKRRDPSDWFEIKEDNVTHNGFYMIEGVYEMAVDISTNPDKAFDIFEANQLDVTSIPSSKTGQVQGTLTTKGDSTFKLNVNSCTQKQWNEFLPTFKEMDKNVSTYETKPCMSNSHFLDGLFFSINRQKFATDRGVNPSINYFSDAYMADPISGDSYNASEEHKAAIAYYDPEHYGFSKSRAIDNFRIAVNEMCDLPEEDGGIVLGTVDNPYVLTFEITWMYGTDTTEYGEEIIKYFEDAFNDPSVCGGKVKLHVTQAVANSADWQEVYNRMLTGQFDLGFGAISGNTLDPLNFLEVLKSDNSSTFTLNWGQSTSKVDRTKPIVYDNKLWSFDSLWTVVDHGGISQNGESVKPVVKTLLNKVTKIGSAETQDKLYEGFEVEAKIQFVDLGNASEADFPLDMMKLELVMPGAGSLTLPLSEPASYDPATCTATLKAKVLPGDTPSDETAVYAGDVNEQIKIANKYDLIDKQSQTYLNNKEKYDHPLNMAYYGDDETKLWDFEISYTLRIGGVNGSTSDLYSAVKAA